MYRGRCANPACDNVCGSSSSAPFVCWCGVASYCSDTCRQADAAHHRTVCLATVRSEVRTADARDAAEPTKAGVSTERGETGDREVLKSGCGSCGRVSAGLKKCARCNRVSYCDRNCQRADWPRHRSTCRDSEDRSHERSEDPKHGVDCGFIDTAGFARADVSTQDGGTGNKKLLIKHECGSCGKLSGSLKECARCRKVCYCNRNCQRTDWPRHRSTCRDSDDERSVDPTQAVDCKVVTNTAELITRAAGVSTQRGKTSDREVLKSGCGSCGKVSAGLKKCARCNRVSYCDRDCQRADWPRHRSTCRDSAKQDITRNETTRNE